MNGINNLFNADFELVLRVYKEWDDRFRVETSDQFKSLAGVLQNEVCFEN